MVHIILYLLIGAAHSTVLIPVTSAPRLEYRAMLKAHPDFESPTDHYLRHHPLFALRGQLLERFTVAQRAFLENSELEARQKFAEVLQLLWSDDWSDSDRGIFLHAYLRMAQLEANPSARDRYLRQSLLLGPDVTYDPTLFPPPLLRRRTELLGKLSTPIHLHKAMLSNGATVLINGYRCDGGTCGDWIPKLWESAGDHHLRRLAAGDQGPRGP